MERSARVGREEIGRAGFIADPVVRWRRKSAEGTGAGDARERGVRKRRKKEKGQLGWALGGLVWGREEETEREKEQLGSAQLWIFLFSRFCKREENKQRNF